MWYRVSGKLSVKIYCDCPNCDGDAYWNGQKVVMDIEAETPEEAESLALKEIQCAMQHDDANVSWRDEPAVEVTEFATATMLRKLGVPELL